ncbi:MAG TPA: DUF5666 domain-containing protein [Dehalococcoidia bacterium]|nr:DUF5666 domain-containing protein [Dehalococcoidia bacterium]
MAGLTIDFRKAAIALAIVGGILGVAFGVGVAYGRGSPKTVDSGMSQAQIQQLLGLGGTGGAGSTGLGGGTGFTGGGAGGAGLTSLLGGGTAGVITAMTDTSITIETRQGTHTINLGPATTVEAYTGTGATALKPGDAIIVSGETAADGSIAATTVSQLPDELKSLASGTTGSGATDPTGATGGRAFRSGATGATGPTGATAPKGATGAP